MGEKEGMGGGCGEGEGGWGGVDIEGRLVFWIDQCGTGVDTCARQYCLPGWGGLYVWRGGGL